MSKKKAYSPLPIIPEQPELLSPETTLEPEEISVPTYKQSGHYIDTKLKHGYGKPKQKEGEQLTLWDALLPETKEGDIARFEPYKEDQVVEGIRLSTQEDKTINAVMRILQNKSGKDHLGNLPAEVVAYGGKQQKAPKLGVSIHEIAVQTYGEEYSGRELDLLKDTSKTLSEKRFLISYRRLRPDSKYDIIEEYVPLIKLYGVYRDVSAEEAKDKTYRSRGDFALSLNPIFIDQIDTKFIEFPIDIDRRTMIAAEALNGRYPKAVIQLRDYLIRWLSNNKGATTEIDEERLFSQLGLEKYIREGRRVLIKKNTEKALKTVKALGMVSKIDRVTGAKGQWKYVFTLNRDWK